MTSLSKFSGCVNKHFMRRWIFKKQQISFSVSKVLYAQQEDLVSPSQKTEKNQNKPVELDSGASSIIAKRLYQNKTFPKNFDHTSKSNLSQSAGDLRLRLQDLSRQMESTLASPNSEGDSDIHPDQLEQTSLKDAHNFEEEDHSVEQLIFKDDVLSLPKPAPLLGTEDPSVLTSEFPCVGCGALLQCHNRFISGFLPSENFKLMTKNELKMSICQRCYYIKHYEKFLSVAASPDTFARMISKIRDTRSVVVMVVDVMDITGSIIPNLMNYIGHKHPLIVVGNKADLLAPDSPEYLLNMTKELKKVCYDAGYSNVRKVTFVSAKTGYGVERLINLLFSYYKQRVDVFLVGTANAGKSSLFNTLLASDYCKHTVRDLIKRATVSIWPGTTMSFLKFPIMRPSSRTVALRHKRLKQEKALKKETRKLREERKKERQKTWELKDDVNKTDIRTKNQKEEDAKKGPWGQEIAGYNGSRAGDIILPNSLPAPSAFDAENFSNSFWLYDTPGVMNPDQVMNLLEENEMPFLNPTNMIKPRCVLLKPGTTVFASGLARLDFIQGNEPLIATFHCSCSVPLKVISTEEADEFYQQNVGTSELGIPLGNEARVAKIPPLESKQFEFEGENNKLAVADIQLSSVGWVSIAPKAGHHATLLAYTPGAIGLALRVPSLAARFNQFKGKKISGSPFFYTRPQGLAMIGKTLPPDKKTQ